MPESREPSPPPVPCVTPLFRLPHGKVPFGYRRMFNPRTLPAIKRVLRRKIAGSTRSVRIVKQTHLPQRSKRGGFIERAQVGGLGGSPITEGVLG